MIFSKSLPAPSTLFNGPPSPARTVVSESHPIAPSPRSFSTTPGPQLAAPAASEGKKGRRLPPTLTNEVQQYSFVGKIHYIYSKEGVMQALPGLYGVIDSIYHQRAAEDGGRSKSSVAEEPAGERAGEEELTVSEAPEDENLPDEKEDDPELDSLVRLKEDEDGTLEKVLLEEMSSLQQSEQQQQDQQQEELQEELHEEPSEAEEPPTMPPPEPPKKSIFSIPFQPPASLLEAFTLQFLKKPKEAPKVSPEDLKAEEELAKKVFESKPPMRGANIDGRPVLGFDIEWKPSFVAGCPQNKVALVQLCFADECFLFHIAKLQAFPPALQEFLENEFFIKVGVNVRGDVLKLKRDFGVEVNSFLDLVEYAKTTLGEEVPASLGGLTSRLLSKNLLKSKRLVMSNWENNLTTPQMIYAANDASAGYELFVAIRNHPGPPTRKKNIDTSGTPLVRSFEQCYPALTRKRAGKKADKSEKDAQPAAKKPKYDPQGIPFQPLTDTPPPPTVQHAHHLFYTEGKSIEEIAEIKAVKTTTVESYLAAAAVDHGMPLDFDRAGVTEHIYRRVDEVATKYEGQENFMKSVRTELGPDFSFNIIKLALGWRARNRKDAQDGE